MKRKIFSFIVVLFCMSPSFLSAQQQYASTPFENLYENGRQLFLQGEYGPAKHYLQEYLTKNPKSNSVLEIDYMLACSAYKLKEDKCAESLREHLMRYPDTPYRNSVYILLATNHYYEGRYEEAVKLFKEATLTLLSDAERDEATYHLALSLMETGELEEAGVWFRTLEAVSEKYRDDSRYNLAYLDYMQGRYGQAFQSFEYLSAMPKYKELASYYLAEIHLIRKEYEKAASIATHHIAAYPKAEHRAEMERILGTCHYYSGRPEQAIEPLSVYVSATENPDRNTLYLLGMACYQNRIFLRATDVLGRTTSENDALTQNAYYHIGLAYLQLYDSNKARMAFEQAASADFDLKVKEQALYNYAVGIHETAYSPFDESVTVFERFLNEFPASPYTTRVSDYLVEVYMNTRSYDAALRSIDKISKPTARILEAKQKILFQLGTQHFANARFEDAISLFDQSLKLARYNSQTAADAWYWRGEANYRLGNIEQTSRDLRQYFNLTRVKNNDMYALAHYTMGYIAFKQKDYEKAEEWFARYVEMGSDEQRPVLADAYNRIGDCHFRNRRFADAQQSYSHATRLDAQQADYSLYQEAFVLGLQKDYLGKIHVLNKLIEQYPESQYQDDAIYERGRAYVMLEDPSRAIATFRELLAKYPESAITRKAANEIGLLYYQSDNYTEAIKAYKQVINTYPGSEEARLAQRDLKSIYIDLNKVDEYAEFAASIPGGASFDVSERDSLTYIAAEKVYMRGEVREARSSFLRYLQSFPEGAYSLNANYYVGLIDYNQRNYGEAVKHLEKVLQFPDNRYSEEAMAISAEIYYNALNMERALAIYKQLSNKASTPERLLLAKTGALRSAYALNSQPDIIATATDLLAQRKLAPELANEARYYRMKANLSLNKPQAAIDDLKALAKDTRNVYGAESKYLLADIYFKENRTADAEKEILDYIDRSTPHAYWLARSFILLADVYTAEGRNLEARQYLLSLQQNYQAKDDIARMIENRLNKLNP